MEYVVLKDDDFHQYRVPVELADDFEPMLEEIRDNQEYQFTFDANEELYANAISAFDNKFEQFMFG